MIGRNFFRQTSSSSLKNIAFKDGKQIGHFFGGNPVLQRNFSALIKLIRETKSGGFFQQSEEVRKLKEAQNQFEARKSSQNLANLYKVSRELNLDNE